MERGDGSLTPQDRRAPLDNVTKRFLVSHVAKLLCLGMIFRVHRQDEDTLPKTVGNEGELG